jgi:hypothetical protein
LAGIKREAEVGGDPGDDEKQKKAQSKLDERLAFRIRARAQALWEIQPIKDPVP